MQLQMQLQKGDVIRARRAGNKHKGNYVIEKVCDPLSWDSDYLSVYAHIEYGIKSSYMMFEKGDIKIIRTYA